MSTGHDLLRSAAALTVEVISAGEDDVAPAGSIEVELRIGAEDVEWGALPLLFALGVLSYSEALPAGSSDMHYDAEDEWSVSDLVEHLRYTHGHLVLSTDYVRGRMMKTTVDIAPDGVVRLRVLNRGATARRWISLLQGNGPHLALAPVLDSPMGPFYDANGGLLRCMDDWRALHPARHWKDGRSARLLAETWGGAGGFPDTVLGVLDAEACLRDLDLERGLVEHKTSTPGQGAPSQTDILVIASDPLGNRVVLGVEGKVDEGFGQPIRTWLAAGSSARSAQNRRSRLERMLWDLGLDRDVEELGDIAYQLVHRTWATVEEAVQRRAPRSVMLVHSFLELNAERPGWSAFVSFCGLFGVHATAGRPQRLGTAQEVDLWVAWVSQSPEAAPSPQ